MLVTTKRIVCLANSRKPNGRCIAGVELQNGRPAGWIRPVSSREHQEVSEDERQYQDGRDPRVLDVIDVPLLRSVPKTFQQENWLLDPRYYWAKVGQVTWDGLSAYTDPVDTLWVNGFSTFHGLHDRMPLATAETLTSSLVLIPVDRLTLVVFPPGQAFGDAKRRVQARFRYAGTDYRIRVTDPVYERAFLAQPDGEYDLGECYLTVSLGEPWEGYCYKLVAAIVEPAAGTGPTA